MLIEVEAFTGEASPARRALAARIATEALGWLNDIVKGIVIRVPSGSRARAHAVGSHAELACSVVVVLRDGRRFDAIAGGENVTDALERACHDVRREVAGEAGRRLRRRRVSETSRTRAVVAELERREA